MHPGMSSPCLRELQGPAVTGHVQVRIRAISDLGRPASTFKQVWAPGAVCPGSSRQYTVSASDNVGYYKIDSLT